MDETTYSAKTQNYNGKCYKYIDCEINLVTSEATTIVIEEQARVVEWTWECKMLSPNIGSLPLNWGILHQ